MNCTEFELAKFVLAGLLTLNGDIGRRARAAGRILALADVASLVGDAHLLEHKRLVVGVDLSPGCMESEI